MSNLYDLTSHVANKSPKTADTHQPKPPRYVRTREPGVSIAFENGKIQTKGSDYVDITVKQKNFDAWKAHAEEFDWDVFAIPDSLKGGIQGNASSRFHRHASATIRENGWEKIHAMTLWTLLPEAYKSEWQAAAKLGGEEETSKPTPPCMEVPNFKELGHFYDEKCAYFTFQAAPDPSACPVVDTGKGNQPGSSRDSFPTSRHTTCDTTNGAILPTDKIVHTGDDKSQPIPDLLDYLLDFDNGLMPIGQPIPSELNVLKSSPKDIPNFEFGFTSEFGVYNLPPRNSIPPPSPEDLTRIHDEQRPTKRRRKNPKENTRFSGNIQNPEPLAPSNGVDSLFGLQVPPLSSIDPWPQGLMTQRQSDTGLENPPTIGRESKQRLWNHQDASSSQRPRSPAQATGASASLFSYTSASAGDYAQEEYRDEYHIGASIFWEHSEKAPLKFTGSGQSSGDDTLTLDSEIFAEILSNFSNQPMKEYPTDSLLETQEGLNYEFPGGFGF